jgi:hypothetical protein
MMPIVFWASLVPWASETSDAEPIWPYRKPVLVRSRGTPRVVRYTSQVPTAATSPAMNGESAAGMITDETRPRQITPWPPTAAIIAPTMPPITACDELDGMPSSQVSRFQTMPPTRPAKTSSSETRWESTRPFAIVAATAVDKNAPTRFSTPDSATATRGFRAPLAIDVAIALPVS